MSDKIKPTSYSRYPLKNVITYNLVTILHYIFGFAGILYALNFSNTAQIAAVFYVSFAFVQMYVLMPIMVCPNCVYTKKPGMFCVTGLNIIARKLPVEGDINNFADRGKGILCHNNLYLAAKIIPLVIMLPFVFINYSPTLLGIFLIVLALLLLRIFYLFKKLACAACLAKNICPNAQSMGLSEG